MNHADLKNYAPQARRDFIQAVTDRAAFYGVTASKIAPITVKGDVAIIGGHAFPASVVAKRKKLVDRIDRDGFDQTMEALAYTWFNRFVAIRFMELHGYLEHGYRVLSHPDPTKTIPEILELAEHVDLPGLSREKVIDLKLDVNKEGELYQMLLLAQCHALHSAMPFLFEGIDDETELVLPENLLHSDSIIRKLVDASDPEDWQEVEVLGWLYQFYISERKDEVMARKGAVPTEDIPAVTQLFTPHWIVRYLVENSLGRLWLLNRPGSNLREHMPYYIKGEAETDFLKITKPEDIRLLDPACGSGHMLTYAFDLLFLIYEEEGYVPKEIPALILRHNLHGLEICPRAAQLAGMALAFKARAKSPRFFQPASLVPPRILALQNIRFDEGELRDYIAALDLGGLFSQPMLQLLYQFEEATTFGSLIQPCLDEAGIAYARQAIETKDLGSQLFLRETQGKVLRALDQAEMLCQRYDVAVANPPYMGSVSFNASLKAFAKTISSEGRTDLFALFIARLGSLATTGGYVGMITMQSWLFLASYESLRREVLTRWHITSMAHLGPRAFDSLGGEVVQTAAFVIRTKRSTQGHGVFFRLTDGCNEAEKQAALIAAIVDPNSPLRFFVSSDDVLRIPGCPLAYWLSENLIKCFAASEHLGDILTFKQGAATSDNGRFLRLWHEVSQRNVDYGCRSYEDLKASLKKWFPYNKGGTFRKWYGNNEHVVNWENDGREMKEFTATLPQGTWVRLKSREYYCLPCITYSALSGGAFGSRNSDAGFLFDTKGSCIFGTVDQLLNFSGLLNSKPSKAFLDALCPTLDYSMVGIKQVPVPARMPESAAKVVATCCDIARADWDNFETSWHFQDQPLLRPGLKSATLEASWRNWEAHSNAVIVQMQELEMENNRLFIAAYGLDSELQPEVPEEQITLTHADSRRDIAAFLSYGVGCMMGRYSLDKPGLILADTGDSLSEYLARVGKPLESLTFSPGEDAIIPVLDGEWFQCDIVIRARDFVRASFGEATLDANLRYIEDSLDKDLRKYFVTEFFKDHLQTYKKRPIYWLFSSGKERAFQALVYLHRYQEGTLSRMRTEYVIPLQGKIASRIDQLADDIQKATSTSHRKKMEKERDKLLRQRTELQAFDERLRHYADQRIQLHLDDGVKVNYGKFGDLLAEANAVTGGSDE